MLYISRRPLLSRARGGERPNFLLLLLLRDVWGDEEGEGGGWELASLISDDSRVAHRPGAQFDTSIPTTRRVALAYASRSLLRLTHHGVRPPHQAPDLRAKPRILQPTAPRHRCRNTEPPGVRRVRPERLDRALVIPPIHLYASPISGGRRRLYVNPALRTASAIGQFAAARSHFRHFEPTQYLPASPAQTSRLQGAAVVAGVGAPRED